MTFRESLNFPDEWDGRIWHLAHPNPSAREHVHDEIELNLITRGHCRYLVNGRRIDMAPHQLLWLFPDEPHVLVDTSHDFQMWVGVFRIQRWRKLLRGEKLGIFFQRCPKEAHVRLLRAPDAKRLETLCQEVAENEGHSPIFHLGLQYCLLLAWQTFLRATKEHPRAIHPAVFKASVLLQENAERHSVQQIATKVGLSSSRLSVLFAKQVGMSLTAYRNQQCLNRFRALLEKKRFENLTELALESGFGSYAQFSRVYKTAVGTKPRELLGHRR